MFKKFAVLLLTLTLAGCGPAMLFPPEIDLMPLERIGLITFSVENAEGQLDSLATQRFLQNITRFQNVQVIELGRLNGVLRKIDKTTIDVDAAKAIGKEFGVSSFFTGTIRVSDVKPKVSLSALIRHMRVQAVFDIDMTARLITTDTGATRWTDSSIRKGSLAFLSMGQEGIPYFDIRDQDETYMRLVEDIVRDVTRDFRPHPSMRRRRR